MSKYNTLKAAKNLHKAHSGHLQVVTFKFGTRVSTFGRLSTTRALYEVAAESALDINHQCVIVDERKNPPALIESLEEAAKYLWKPVDLNE